MNQASPFDTLPNTFDPTSLEQAAACKFTTLNEFIDRCSPNPEVRSATVTALVFSLWQTGVRGTLNQPPSFILLNGAKTTRDPVFTFIEQFIGRSYSEKEDRCGAGKFIGGTPEGAPRAMLNAVYEQRKLNAQTTPNALCNMIGHYHDARLAGYGPGDTNRYPEPWHPQLGLITDPRNSIILTVENEVDWAAFKNDVFKEPSRLRKPTGPGMNLEVANKTLGIRGTITPEQLDGKLVDAALALGLPLFLLPHCVDDVVHVPNMRALSTFGFLWNSNAKIQINTTPLLSDDAWHQAYHHYLWKRLEHLPMQYRAPIFNSFQQLDQVCGNIACGAAEQSKISYEDLAMLTVKLCMHTKRGITMSLASLAWYGLGFATGCSLNQTRKLSRKLREVGHMTLRDAMRTARFSNAKQRDDVIERLAKEGLLVLEDRNVIARSMPEFLDYLHTCSELPAIPIVQAKSNSPGASH